MREGFISDIGSLMRWLAGGERGGSSNTIVTHLTKLPANGAYTRVVHHPVDPGDLRRCRLLLEQVPELAPRLHEMATASQEWARLVQAWNRICSTMDKEDPQWRTGLGRTPKTYKLMQKVIGNHDGPPWSLA